MLLLRRIIFVTLLITLSSISSRNLIGILIFFQFIYGIYIIFIRPFKEAKGNLIEILNEAYFSLFLVTLMIFNTQNEWNSFKINIYIWILASNSLFVFLIIFICLIKTMIKCCKNKCQKNKDNQEIKNKITPLPQFTQGAVVYPHQSIYNRRVLDTSLTTSTNQPREESKYVVHDNISEIQIVKKKNWD